MPGLSRKKGVVLDDIEPGARLEGESDPAFAAFVCYRDMGEERSVRRVARVLDKSDTLIGRWSSENAWVERIRAWEDEQDRVRRRAHLKSVKEATERHVNLAKLLQQKVFEKLRSMAVVDANGKITVGESVALRDLHRWLEVAVKVERLSLGLDTEKATHDHRVEGAGSAPPPVEEYDYDELLANPALRRALDATHSRANRLAGDTGGARGKPERRPRRRRTDPAEREDGDS